MDLRKLLFLTLLMTLAVSASASANFGHVVAPGESLYAVAATDGLSVSELATANGISPDSQLAAGSTLQIPPASAAVSAAPATGSATGSGSGEESSSSSGESAGAAASAPAASQSTSSGSTSSGGYTVHHGDTLSAIAARYGTTVGQLAAANSLDPSGILPAGASLSVRGSSSSEASTTGPVSAQAPSSTSSSESSSSGAAQPTPETVSPSDVGHVAAANGVSPSLAEAIGDQESGFNNNLVSKTGATGVMQIEPATWDYIGTNLATPPPLSPTSARDNVRGGVLLLRSLLGQTGGDPAMAAAGYYQGIQSVRRHGMYADTQRYVNDVMALRHRFGGP
jgi:LysM repeat protein